jgi:large subunit ribosomal protein L15
MTIIDYLKAPKGANKRTKKRGRGQGSGHGKTACRGHKGQSARGNTKKYKGIEGGQMPLARRLPKRGFNNKYKRDYQIVHSVSLNLFSDGTVVNPDILKSQGLIKDRQSLVKVLNAGQLKKRLEVCAHGFSKQARLAIEGIGGKAVVLVKPSPVKRRVNDRVIRTQGQKTETKNPKPETQNPGHET